MQIRTFNCVKRQKSSTEVSIRKFKDFVFTALPEESPLHKVLAKEDDEISREEFIAKFPIWWELATVVHPVLIKKKDYSF